MTCPGRRKLLKYQDNALDQKDYQKIKTHIDQCDKCRDELSFLTALQTIIRTDKVPRRVEGCIDGETLSAYLDNSLHRKERKIVEEHLSQCDYCLNELTSLHEFLNSVEMNALERTPDELLAPAGVAASRIEEPRKEPWARRFLSLFSIKAEWGIPVVVATCVLIIALGILSILHVSQDRTNQTASDIQGAFTYLAKSEGIADALQPFIHEVDLSHSMDKITRGIIENESILALTRYFLAGVCIAESYLSISKMDESEVLRQHSISSLFCLETLLNQPDSATLSKKSSELRARAESGLYSGSDLTPFVLELSSGIWEIAIRKRMKSNFLFGQWLVALSTQAELAAMTPDDEHLRKELDKLLRSETIQFFKSHLNMTSNEKQQWLVSVWSKIEEFSAKDTLKSSDLRELATRLRKAINIYLSYSRKSE